ncbi:hypothetical protein F7725_004150 [Dissostichus mawsoni]|uniref:Uncharacterized protein n=1 Tax=Dissostichus mawsoni TaxID=36200 RepID=A0A7J5XHW0_DISMA|nr:hypothetical protein F7725_004150 [Dissostichus mawsoni]
MEANLERVRGRAPPTPADIMCTGACSKFIAIPLYILAAVSIICNIMLFFPDFDTKYAEQDQEGERRITEEVKYMAGLIGGGILVLIPAIHTHLTSAKNCCANRCGVSLHYVDAV